ncbi:MAG: sigma 54-interacting transcriptional regulator, partial [Kofleriaceae bacterium]
MASHREGECPVAGTKLADGEAMAGFRSQLAADVVWRHQRDRFFITEAHHTTRITIGLGILVQLALLAIFWHAGYPTWRIVALAALYVSFAVGHKLIIGCTTDPHKVASSFLLMNVTAQLFIIGSAGLSGGVHSPFLPSTVLPAIVSLLFFGPQALSRWIAVGNALLIVAMVALPTEVVGPSLPAAQYTVAIVLGLSWNLMMLHVLVGKLSVIASTTGESMACLREERLSDAEAQLRRLQSVGAKVAHELKNPLASIKGLCQLVARTPESERTQERLVVVASEISRMETILNEYLSFSRPLEDIKPEPIQLADLARDVLDVLDGRAVQGGITLTVDGSASPVHGDPRRLKEALINLVANAIEATPNGGSVSLRVRNASAGGAVLEVQDSGRGISSDDLERLGTSFFTTRPNGTGWGRARAGRDHAARWLARLRLRGWQGHHGHDHAARTFDHAPGTGPSRGDDRGPRVTTVLLVDDEPGVLFTLGELLVERGHRAIAARSGEEALTKLDEADAVVTDLSMPRMDGLELMAQIAQRDPALPVILLTAHGSEKVAVAAMKQGAYDYVAKPFDIDELAVVIERALEARRLRIDNRRLSAEQTLGRRIIGTSKPMRRLLEATSRIATRDVTVLVRGETGTGKEFVAELLHAQSARAKHPLVRFNCAALPADLADAELFGHVRGAFTGATSGRPGFFAQANGGTLILDEVGELPLTLQAKLLRALQ